MMLLFPVGSRPPLILQSPPPYTSPRDAAPDLLMDSPERKKKQKKMIKEEGEKGAMYDIVSSPSKDSTKLTLKLSRVKSADTEQPGDLMPGGVEHGSDAENDLPCNSFQEQSGYQQVPVLQNTGALAAKQPGAVSGTPYDEAELDALAEIERIERESAIERERCSKEVQDKGSFPFFFLFFFYLFNYKLELKPESQFLHARLNYYVCLLSLDKPLKKRKQDSYPQEPGAAGTAGTAGGPGVGGGGSAGNKPTPQEASAASNGANRPALMVSIDLQQAGRAEGQLECPVPAQEAQRWAEDGSDSAGVLRLKTKTDEELQRAADGRPEVIKQQKMASDGRPETPKHKQESRRDSSGKVQGSDKRPDLPKHRHDTKSDKIRPETPRKDGRPELSRDGHREEKHKDRERDRERSSDGSKIRRPETPKSSSRSEQERPGRDRDRERDKERDKDRDKDRDRERKHRAESREHRDRRSPEHRSRPDSPRVKQESRSGPDSGRPRTDLKSPNSKEERRSSDGTRKSSDGSKLPPPDSRAGEFPDFLLGGKSGALKNFVIPKLKRDKDGNAEPRRPGENWTQPRVKLERLGLVEDISKRSKPVVVLQKLSLDEVQKIIKERHGTSSKSGKNRPSFGKSSKGKTIMTINPDILVAYFKKKKHLEALSFSKYEQDSSTY